MAGLRILNSIPGPHLVWVAEPENKFRFRYESEAGSHGGLAGKKGPEIASLLGEPQKKSKAKKEDKKKFPTVKLENYHTHNDVFIRVSLHTTDHEEHVLQLKGKHVKENGICYEDLGKDFTATFTNLIIRTKKIEDAQNVLMERREHLKTHSKAARTKLVSQIKERAKEIMNSAILCFQAFSHQKPDVPICDALWSDTIYNQKSSLRIHRMSRWSGSCKGSDEVILLCDKVKKNKINVVFFELDENEENTIWEANGSFEPKADVHHQVAITFKTPSYRKIGEKIVKVCLRQDDEQSESVEFSYIIVDDDMMAPIRKRRRNEQSSSTSTSCDTNYVGQLSPSSSSNDGSSEYARSCEIQPVPDEISPSFASLISNEIIFLNQVQDANAIESQALPSFSNFQLEYDQNFQSFIDDQCPSGIEGQASQNVGDVDNTDFENMCLDLNLSNDMKALLQDIDVGVQRYDLINHLTISSEENDFGNDIFETDAVKFHTSTCDESSKTVQIQSLLINFAKLMCDDYSRSVNSNNDREDCIIMGSDETDNFIKTPAPADIGAGYANATKHLEEAVEKDNRFRKHKVLEKEKLKYQADLAELFSREDSKGNSPLHLAVLHHKNLFPILKMIKFCRSSIVNKQNKNKQTAIHLATQKDAPDLLNLLYLNKADYNIKDTSGNNCIHIAAKNNSIRCLRLLLLLDKSEHVNAFNYDGFSALHLAVINHAKGCFHVLLKTADLNVKDKTRGRTPLHYAVEANSCLFVKGLLEMPSIDVNAQDLSGDSPLHLASAMRYFKLVCMLLEAGADPMLKNFKKIEMESEQESSDDEYLDCTSDTVEETTNNDTIDGLTSLDVASCSKIIKILTEAINKQSRKAEEECLTDHALSKLSQNAGMSLKSSKGDNMSELLDKELDVSDWRRVAMYLGMEDYGENALISSTSPAQSIIKFLKKLYGDNCISVLKNALEMAELKSALSIVQDNCC